MNPIEITIKNLREALDKKWSPGVVSICKGNNQIFLYWHQRVPLKEYIHIFEDRPITNKYVGQIRLLHA